MHMYIIKHRCIHTWFTYVYCVRIYVFVEFIYTSIYIIAIIRVVVVVFVVGSNTHISLFGLFSFFTKTQLINIYIFKTKKQKDTPSKFVNATKFNNNSSNLTSLSLSLLLWLLVWLFTYVCVHIRVLFFFYVMMSESTCSFLFLLALSLTLLCFNFSVSIVYVCVCVSPF